MRNSLSIKILIHLFSILLIGGLFNQVYGQDRAIQDTISNSRNWQPMPKELNISSASMQMNMQVPSTQSLTTPVNGFSDEFAPANWTFDADGGDGSVDTGNVPTSINLISSDNQSGAANNTTYCITIPGSNEGVLEFDWDYESNDVDGPLYDPFGYIVNGTVTQLTDDNGADIQSGSVSFTINAGDQFCFLARSTDQQFGRAETLVSNFSFTPPAPKEENVFTTSGTWTAPEGVFEITVEAWGGGGGGVSNGNSGGGGGGGGAYAQQTIPVTPGTTYSFTVGLGGSSGVDGEDTFFEDGTAVLAKGGATGNNNNGGTGGASTESVGSITFSGGDGGDGRQGGNPNLNRPGGGGGGSAFTTSNGGNGGDFRNIFGFLLFGGLGGDGTGVGGNGGTDDGSNGQNGVIPGGGGGGSARNGTGGAGADGQIIISYELPAQPDPAQTTITANPDILVSDGISTSNITVQAIDQDGVNISDGGATVTISATDGTLSAVTDNNDGTYTASYTSSTNPGVVAISGTINGDTINDTAEIELTPASGSTYYSIQSGDFDNPNLWSFTGHDGAPAGFAPGSSDIIFIGGNSSTNHTITLVNNFTLNEPGELNVVDTGDGAGILSTGNFVISGTGEFTLENGSTLEIGSADGISISASSGNIQTSVRSFGEEANYVYNGQSVQNTGNALPTDVNNLTIDNTNNVLAGQAYRVNGVLNLLNGAFVIGDGLSLIANNKNIISGELIYQLEIYGQPGYRMLSSPIATDFDNLLSGVLTQGYTGASLSGDLQPNVLWYEESFEGTDNQRWRAPTNATNQVVPGRGYFVYMFGDVENDNRYNNPLPYLLEVNGQENEGSAGQIDLNVTYTAEADTGWNMVGNPYGAAIDWEHPSWTKINIDPTIYVWDPNTNQYLTWNGSAGDIEDGILAPFQSFWVKANDENPELIVNENAKTFGGSFAGKAAEQENTPLISINARYSRRYQSTAHFSFSESASYGLDQADAYKLLPPPGVSDYLEIYSLTNRDDRLAINNLPRRFGSNITIPFSINAYKDGFPISDEIELIISNFDHIPEAWEIVVTNEETGEKFDLRQYNSIPVSMSHLENQSIQNQKAHKTGYEVISRDTESHIQFTLEIYPGSDAEGLPQSFNLGQNYPNPFNPSTTLQFDLPIESNVNIEIYDMMGRKVETLVNGALPAGSHDQVWNASRYSSGVYIIRMITNEGVFVRKVTLIK